MLYNLLKLLGLTYSYPQSKTKLDKKKSIVFVYNLLYLLRKMCYIFDLNLKPECVNQFHSELNTLKLADNISSADASYKDFLETIDMFIEKFPKKSYGIVKIIRKITRLTQIWDEKGKMEYKNLDENFFNELDELLGIGKFLKNFDQLNILLKYDFIGYFNSVSIKRYFRISREVESSSKVLKKEIQKIKVNHLMIRESDHNYNNQKAVNKNNYDERKKISVMLTKKFQSMACLKKILSLKDPNFHNLINESLKQNFSSSKHKASQFCIFFLKIFKNFSHFDFDFFSNFYFNPVTIFNLNTKQLFIESLEEVHINCLKYNVDKNFSEILDRQKMEEEKNDRKLYMQKGIVFMAVFLNFTFLAFIVFLKILIFRIYKILK